MGLRDTRQPEHLKKRNSYMPHASHDGPHQQHINAVETNGSRRTQFSGSLQKKRDAPLFVTALRKSYTQCMSEGSREFNDQP